MLEVYLYLRTNHYALYCEFIKLIEVYTSKRVPGRELILVLEAVCLAWEMQLQHHRVVIAAAVRFHSLRDPKFIMYIIK